MNDFPEKVNCPACGSESKQFSYGKQTIPPSCSSDGKMHVEHNVYYRCPNPECPDLNKREWGLFIGWNKRE